MVLVEEESRRFSGAFASLQETHQLGNPPQHFFRIQNFELASARVLKDTIGLFILLLGLIGYAGIMPGGRWAAGVGCRHGVGNDTD